MRLQGGVPLSPRQAPDLYRLVEGLAARAQIDAPALYLLPDAAPNAVAIGSPRGSALAVTQGLLAVLDWDECAGVIAHEIGHLRNADTTLLRVAGSMLRTLQALLRVAVWVAFIGWFVGGLPLAAALWTMAVATVVPLLAVALHQALSRTREFAADAVAAELTGRPRALASALRKLSQVERRWMALLLGVRAPPPWLRSHPATRERIERLEQMHVSMG